MGNKMGCKKQAFPGYGGRGSVGCIHCNLGRVNVSLCPPIDGERMEADLPLVEGPCFQLRSRDEQKMYAQDECSCPQESQGNQGLRDRQQVLQSG